MRKRVFASFLCAAFLLALMPAALVPAFAAGEMLYGFNFDSESEMSSIFTCGGDTAVLEWVNAAGAGHGDDTAVKITRAKGEGYTSKEGVLRLTFDEPLPAGSAYRITAWIYVPSAENPGKNTLKGPRLVLNGDSVEKPNEIKFSDDFSSLPLDEWKGIDVTLPVQETQNTILDFRAALDDEPEFPDVWYVDNIEIHKIDDGTAVPDSELVQYAGPPIFIRGGHGTYEEFDYEIWKHRPRDPGSMTMTGGGTFQCEWDGLNALFRTGKRMGSTMTYGEYGDIVMEYEAEHNILSGEVSYLTVYGWTEEPTMEFYIVENYGVYKPPGGKGYQGTIEVDGGTYEVYVDTRVNQPSIHGTETFQQYFSVRTDKRTSGTITISDHFKAWEELGLDMSGKLYEIALCAEGYNSSGNANISKHVLTIGDTVYGGSPDEVSEPSAEPAEADVSEETAPPSPEASPAANPENNVRSSDSSPWPFLGIAAAILLIAGLVIFIVLKKRK